MSLLETLDKYTCLSFKYIFNKTIVIRNKHEWQNKQHPYRWVSKFGWAHAWTYKSYEISFKAPTIEMDNDSKPEESSIIKEVLELLGLQCSWSDFFASYQFPLSAESLKDQLEWGLF